MTRMFRDGRTETVRSCTSEAVAFVRAMESADATVSPTSSLQQMSRWELHGVGVCVCGGGQIHAVNGQTLVLGYQGPESPCLSVLDSEHSDVPTVLN